MGRYMKYELKGNYKFILGVLALVLILTTGIYVYIANANESSVLGVIFMGLSVLVIFGTLLITFLYIIGSFRKELYEDRGYLTFTLPLTGNQILGSKLIVAIIWFAILGLVIGLYNAFMTFIFAPIKPAISDIIAIINGIPIREVSVFLLIVFIGGVSTLILIYFSMALSRVTFRNKRIGGFWFVIFLIVSGLVAMGQAKIIQALPYYLDLETFRIISNDMLNYDFHIEMSSAGLMASGNMGNAMLNIAGFIYSIAVGVIFFLGTGYIIENKIDL